MAFSAQLLSSSFIFLITFSFAQISDNNPSSIVLQVTKDVSTHQYMTHIKMGKPPFQVAKLLVDLGGPFLWVDCGSGYGLSSHPLINCRSLQCYMAKENGCAAGHLHDRSSRTCRLNPQNTITGLASSGELAEDNIFLDVQSSGSSAVATVDDFLFSCASTLLLKGLPTGAKGILGLSKTRLSLPSQLSNTFGFQRKFALCLSSSDGVILLGDGPYVSLSGTDISRTLIYTPLISNHLKEYFINVKSIRVDGKRLSCNSSLLSVDRKGVGGTKISTIVPYTTMESTIYHTFSSAYIKAASSMNMTRVASVAPFRVCFSSKGIENTRFGPAVPTIDLVLQSEMVRWKIYGRNSVVKVSDEVMCLGFLDGGLNQKTSIVIGGYQLDDNLLEFDLSTSMLGFSSSLLMRQTSCSDFKMSSMLNKSI